ncbi:MAG: hypothetical protein KJ747_07370 [Actinobacteria bacterium]|nr:hypothetical protein [Actinomycetota bacterium]
MRVIAVALALTAALFLGACIQAEPNPAPETQPIQDELLLAASDASTQTPVAIEGYAFMFKREATDASGTVRQNVGEIVVTKDGKVLREKSPDMFTGAIDPKHQEAPVARVLPEADTERDARLQAQAIAVENDTGTGKYGAIEPFVRRYLIKDASGDLFYISPDGSGYSPAPELVAQ